MQRKGWVQQSEVRMYVRTYVPMLGTHKSTGVHIVECLRDSASQQWNKRVCREASTPARWSVPENYLRSLGTHHLEVALQWHKLGTQTTTLFSKGPRQANMGLHR